VLMLPILLSLFLAPFAGVLGYIITYAEYSKHLVDRRSVRRKALEAGLVSFLFFLIVPPLLIWFFLIR
jgi:H+/Cl- antiporter ClcA